MMWAVFGLFIGDWVAWFLVYPDLTFGAAWSSFGRIRPIHTTSVLFGFGGNALIATSFYVLQRTSRARLPDQLSPWFVLFGYNLFCLLAVTGYLMGITRCFRERYGWARHRDDISCGLPTRAKFRRACEFSPRLQSRPN